MKILTDIARYVVGLLFIISGIIKVNDPVGTSIKMEEYFEVFASDFASFFHVFVPHALAIAVFLSVLEVVLGIALLVKYKMRITTWTLLLLILFFTFLTYYSASTGKVTDCGCFGDAVKLTPWQSFSKDIVLLVLIVPLFIYRNKFRATLKEMTGHIVIIVSFIINTGLAVYAIEHLPFIDFRAYKVGANIPKSMQPSAELKYKYIMTKDGEEHEFDKYPSEGGYEYKDMVLMNPEAQPKITDYGVWNDDGDFTQETFNGAKLVIVIYDATKTDTDSFVAINELVKGVEGQITPIILTASDESTFEAFRHSVQLAVPYYYADATVLKTIVRSNPGVLLFNNGVVLGKWHYNDIPDSQVIIDLIN